MAAQTAAANVSSNVGIKQLPRVFRPHAPLHHYLQVKYPANVPRDKVVFTMAEVMLMLKGSISHEKLLDNPNPVIILCNWDLERSLGVRALHMNQLRETVDAQLVPADSREATIPFGAFPPPPVLPRLFSYQPPRGRWNDLVLRHCPIPFGTPIRSSDRFRLRPEFAKLLEELPEVESGAVAFTYRDIADLFSVYLAANKHTHYDQRNPFVLITQDTPLGAALGVSAFCRSQIQTILRTQLLPLTEADRRASGPDPPLPPPFQLPVALGEDENNEEDGDASLDGDSDTLPDLTSDEDSDEGAVMSEYDTDRTESSMSGDCIVITGCFDAEP